MIIQYRWGTAYIPLPITKLCLQWIVVFIFIHLLFLSLFIYFFYFFLGNIKNMWKTIAHLSNMFNGTSADDLATQVARASADMVLDSFDRNIPISVPDSAPVLNCGIVRGRSFGWFFSDSLFKSNGNNSIACSCHSIPAYISLWCLAHTTMQLSFNSSPLDKMAANSQTFLYFDQNFTEVCS